MPKKKQGDELPQLRMTWWGRRAYDFAGSLYREACPRCGAEPFAWCRSENGRRATTEHPERCGAGAPAVARKFQRRAHGLNF